jgi:hypothetical protein
MTSHRSGRGNGPSVFRDTRVEGRLLHILGDERAHAGRSFWLCFKPLRDVFDEYQWVVASQPWFGWPPGR